VRRLSGPRRPARQPETVRVKDDKEMIKGITIVRPAGTAEAYEKLTNFFSAMGFEAGKGWEEEHSRGVSFVAPTGKFEFADGILPESGEILVEVTGLDTMETVARKWLAEAWSGEEAARKLTPITDTGWKSRAFTVEPVPGSRFTFWEWIDPFKGRPIALEGDLSAHEMRFAIVVSRWNAVITERLLQGALDALLRSGVAKKDLRVIRVPGAWEIPAAARQVASYGEVDAVITLGVLLRGETVHFEAIYNEVSRGIGQSQQETGIPHAFGVLTCETLEQALNRAGIKGGNKGFEAAIAAIEMVSLRRKLGGQETAGRQPGSGSE
jgi:6,7-dimethyl-8-ribityllumazine synthase